MLYKLCSEDIPLRLGEIVRPEAAVAFTPPVSTEKRWIEDPRVSASDLVQRWPFFSVPSAASPSRAWTLKIDGLGKTLSVPHPLSIAMEERFIVTASTIVRGCPDPTHPATTASISIDEFDQAALTRIRAMGTGLPHHRYVPKG